MQKVVNLEIQAWMEAAVSYVASSVFAFEYTVDDEMVCVYYVMKG